MLADTRPIFNRAEHLAQLIDGSWKDLALPDDIKFRFAALWRTRIGYPAEASKGQMKLFTSEDNAEYVADVALAKAICGLPLRQALHDYRKVAKELAVSNGIIDFDQNFKSKRDTPPPNWAAWEAAIISNPITDEEKERLRTFLQDSETFHGIKGIARDDFAAPAVIKAIGHRVDRFGIADQIAFAADDALYNEIVSFVERKTGALSPSVVNVTRIVSDFRQAVVATGFREQFKSA